MESQKEYYYHIRPRNGMNKIIENPDKPSYTFAGIKQNGELRVGFARCSPKDQFCKKKGRDIAKGRAIKNPVNIIIDADNIQKSFIEYCQSPPNIFTALIYAKKHYWRRK